VCVSEKKLLKKRMTFYFCVLRSDYDSCLFLCFFFLKRCFYAFHRHDLFHFLLRKAKIGQKDGRISFGPKGIGPWKKMHEPITPFSPRVVEKVCVSDTDQAPTTKTIKAAAYSSYSNDNIMVLVSCSCNSIIQNWGLLICMSECWTVLRGNPGEKENPRVAHST